MQKQVEHINEGKAGRSIAEQVQLRYDSRVSKQLAKGYRRTIDEARQFEGKNELNLYKPMLAQRHDKVSSYNSKGSIYQRKLDGHRMLVTKQNGNLIAYTRNGKVIDTLDHILDDLHMMPDGTTLDGEIYLHGKPLNYIASRAKKYQEGTEDLCYHIYDCIMDKPFPERLDFLNMIHRELIVQPSNVVIEPYWYYEEISMGELFQKVVTEGYEGLILRLDGYIYQPGKRSKSLLKIKERHDSEFKVENVIVSPKGIPLLVFKAHTGERFKVVPPGGRKGEAEVLQNPDKFIGKEVTISYANLTEYGVPFHPVAERYREDL